MSALHAKYDKSRTSFRKRCRVLKAQLLGIDYAARQHRAFFCGLGRCFKARVKPNTVAGVGRTNVNLLFNAVSWLAILILIAGACYLVSFGLASIVIKVVPALQHFFQTGVVVCSVVLAMFFLSGLVLYLGARRS